MDKRLADRRLAGGRRAGVAGAGVLANLMFWASTIGFAALRPDYSHLTDAISELGAVGAPNAFAFNLLGYIAPGLLLTFSGWTIGRSAAGGVVTPVLLATLGAGLLLAGLVGPDMSDMQSTATRVHMLGSMLGVVCPFGWAVLALRGGRRSRALAVWGVLGVVAFAAAFAVYGLTPYQGAVQRLTFGVALFWYAGAGILLWRKPPVARPERSAVGATP